MASDIEIKRKISPSISFFCLKIDEEQRAQIKQLQEKNARLEHALENLKRMIFGSKSERFVPVVDAAQMELFGIPRNEPPEVRKETITYERRKPKKKRQPVRLAFPSHLPSNPPVLPDHILFERRTVIKKRNI